VPSAQFVDKRFWDAHDQPISSRVSICRQAQTNYLGRVSIAAAKLVEEFTLLEPAEQQEVWRALENRMTDTPSIPNDDPIRTARGMFVGSGLNKALLAERARERARG